MKNVVQDIHEAVTIHVSLSVQTTACMGHVLRLTRANAYLDLVDQHAMFPVRKESGEHTVIKIVFVKTMQHVIRSVESVSVLKVS